MTGIRAGFQAVGLCQAGPSVKGTCHGLSRTAPEDLHVGFLAIGHDTDRGHLQDVQVHSTLGSAAKLSGGAMISRSWESKTCQE